MFINLTKTPQISLNITGSCVSWCNNNSQLNRLLFLRVKNQVYVNFVAPERHDMDNQVTEDQEDTLLSSQPSIHKLTSTL